MNNLIYGNKPVYINNIEDFKKAFGEPDEQLLKIRYLKFQRIVYKINKIREDKHQSIKSQNFEDACNLRDKERYLLEELELYNTNYDVKFNKILKL